ncbi:golgin subfamily A member 7-like [Convolutriloba macropyga]|uniref:golgin subfamily A member 7-like n=1 Tax=Convolutriloba macropyga TaxID=536237 RepID=UPI003F526B1B
MQPSSIQQQPGSVIHGGAQPVGHVPITKTFVQRDYSEGTAVKFQEKLPEELNGKIPADMFGKVIKGINEIFADAEKLGARTYLEGCFGCLTAYIIFLCLESNYDKCLKRLHHFLENVNRSTLNPMGLHMISPMERGLRVIEVLIFNQR